MAYTLTCVSCRDGHGLNTVCDLDPSLYVVQRWAWPKPSPVCCAGMGMAWTRCVTQTLTCVCVLCRDGHGLDTVGLQQLVLAVASLGGAEVALLMAALDTDQGGRVSYEELLQVGGGGG